MGNKGFHGFSGIRNFLAKFIRITDSGGYYIGEEVETALQEIGAEFQSAGTVAGLTKTLFDYVANAGNVDTSETDLFTSTLVASQLAENNDKLLAIYGGSFVSSGTATRQIKVYFGGTVIFDTGALTLSLSSAWVVNVFIIRVSSTVIRYDVEFTTQGAALSAYTASGEVTGLTLSNTQILKITGQAAGVGAATNDIVAKSGTVRYLGQSATVSNIVIADQINNATDKPTPVNADKFGIWDSVSGLLRAVTWANIKATLLVYLQPTYIREKLTANRTYYVRTDGSDSNNGLTDSSDGAFLTASKANTVVATIDKNGYNITVQFGEGNWNESIIINTGIGDGTVTWQGTLTSQETASSATVSAGSGSTAGTVTKTGQFTGNAYAGYIAYFVTDAVYRIIKSNTDNVLTLADITVSSTTQDVTVYAWGTTINKIALPAGTVGVILAFLHLDGTGETYSNYLNPYSSMKAQTCRFDIIIYTQQGNWEEMRDCYFYLVASGGMVQFNGGGGIFGRCFADANHNTGIGIVASRTATLLICGGTVDGDAGGGNKATYGIRAWGASSVQCNGSTLSDGSTTGNLKVQNCDIGVRADTVSSIVGTSVIGYTGNTTNESADGATFGYID